MWIKYAPFFSNYNHSIFNYSIMINPIIAKLNERAGDYPPSPTAYYGHEYNG